MQTLSSSQIRDRFINYFVNILKSKNLGHTKVASSSLIPENHPTLLFTNSGMVQFTPYFLGLKNPITDFGTNRLVSCQKCIRTGDLDIVGVSKYHQTFFEMLGNWSIGDYGKKQAVEISFDLLTNKEYGFGLDPSKFYPTVFGGNNEAPEDTETIEAWKSVGIPESRIPKLPASENWWAPGPVGPCGPCTEVLYDRGEKFGPKEQTPGLTDNPRYLEIWNAGVFMQFNRKQDGTLETLPALCVDTGSGLERLCVLLQNVNSNYDTDLFKPIILKICELSNSKKELENIAQTEVESLSPEKKEIKYSMQKVADHIRTVVYLIAEDLYPSNKDQGYVLRRLIRRIFDECVWRLNIDSKNIVELVDVVVNLGKSEYPELNNINNIKKVIGNEINLYKNVSDKTRAYITKKYKNTIDNPFDIYQSLGASKELIQNIATKQGLTVNFDNFEKQLEEHAEKSRSNMAGRFKGGLGENNEVTTKYHTATHLLQRALKDVLGEQIMQMGSNITAERMRFDFNHPQKLTDEELKKVEQIVNQKIKEGLVVKKIVLPKAEAEKTGATHLFTQKYGDEVSVYYIGDSLQNAYSKEFCGGPHVNNTNELGVFKIVKEEAVAKGVRRIKAILQN